MKVALLSGGVGGARFARGLVQVLAPGELTIIGNVGDDVEVMGLHVSPDLDSLLYALAGLNDETRGWGRAGETWNALDAASAWGGEDWFALGDLDIGLHLVRTHALRSGETLSAVTKRLCERANLPADLVPATDDRLRTLVHTPAGVFGFQRWFVQRGHADDVDGLSFEGAAAARAVPRGLDALAAADVILIAPSNPYVSIRPILAVRELAEALERRHVPCLAVSPLVGGEAVKGPAGRMLSRMAGGTEPRHLAALYEGLIDVLVIDERDMPAAAAVSLVATQTLMTDADASRRLAEVVLEAAA